MKTALVIGATGLVGRQLVKLLLQDNRFEKVVVFVRRSTGLQHSKLREHIIHFEDLESWRSLVTGDVLFSTLGTTLKQAGSKGAQFKVDYTYQYNFAKAAAQNGVPKYVLVSSAGSSPDAALFYSRMKGELERDVQKLSFQQISIIRPGLLAGHRTKSRIGERIGFTVLNILRHFPSLAKYRPIDAQMVAKAMINAFEKQSKNIQTYTLEEVFTLAGN